MPKNLKKKLDVLSDVTESATTLMGKVKIFIIKALITLAVLVVLIAGGSKVVWENRVAISEAIIGKALEIDIENKVEDKVSHSHDKEVESLEARIVTAESKARTAIGKVSTLEKKIEALEIENKKHREFNTQGISILADWSTEMMVKVEPPKCNNWYYYRSSANDPWRVFKDKYESRMLYSLDLRSDCRAYYIPIFGTKTKAN